MLEDTAPQPAQTEVHRPKEVSELIESQRIDIERYPNNVRFFSLTDHEMAQIPWLSYLKDDSSAHMKVPACPAERKILPEELKCEEDLEEPELVNGVIQGPDQFIAMLESKESDKFSSTPIIDIRSKQQLNFRATKYAELPDPISFLHVMAVEKNKKAVSAGYVFDFFVYTDSVFTETIRVTFPANSRTPVAKSARWHLDKDHSDFYIPYPRHNKNARLVCLVSFVVEGQLDHLICIGHSLIEEADGVHSIAFEWIGAGASRSMEDVFNSPNEAILDLTASVETVETPNFEKTAMLTSNSNMYPSPLLTVSGMHITFGKSITSENTELVIDVSVHRGHDVVPCGVDMNEGERVNVVRSPAVKFAKSFHCLTPFNFVLNSCDLVDVSIGVEVLVYVGGALKPVFQTQLPITSMKEKQMLKLQPNSSFWTDLKNQLTKKGHTIECQTTYPIINAPPRTINPVVEEDTKTMFFKEIFPYVISAHLYELRFLVNSFQNIDPSALKAWIQNYFYADESFIDRFTGQVISLLPELEPIPWPFLQLIFKACVCCSTIPPIVEEMLFAIAGMNSPRLQESANAFLVRTVRFFPTDYSLKLTVRYLRKLRFQARLVAYEFLFSDFTFICCVCRNKLDAANLPLSPYVPILSLYFSTVSEAFVLNKEEIIQTATNSLRILTTVLEMYASKAIAGQCSLYLFPLLTIIFTFYDSFRAILRDTTIFAPFILFQLQNCSHAQFIAYFTLLSPDNQIRFIDFLASLSSTSNITSIAENAYMLTSNVLSCIHEITWRVLKFSRFVEDLEDPHPSTLVRVITLLGGMLGTKHPASCFPQVLQNLAYIVEKFSTNIFNDKTSIIFHLFKMVIPLTQRKLFVANVCSRGFIKWLVAREKTVSNTCIRCDLSLQYAICHAFLDDSNFNFPPPDNELENTRLLYIRLEEFKNCTNGYRAQIRKLLDTSNDFRHFPGIRARLYHKIISINEAKLDLASAYVAQWDLCRLIVSVLRQTTDKTFDDFFVEEPEVFYTAAIPESSSYLLTCGDDFSEESFCEALKKAMMLCQKSGLNWRIGDTTDFLFSYLEEKREFNQLKDHYIEVGKSFKALYTSEKPPLSFYHIALFGDLKNALGYPAFIVYLESKKYDAFKEELNILLQDYDFTIQDDAGFISESTENIVQITKVKYSIEELKSLKATNFSFTIESEDCVDIYTFATEEELPSPCSMVRVSVSKRETSAKNDYYLRKLNKYRDSLADIVKRSKAIIPPIKMKSLYSHYPIHITSNSLLIKLEKVLAPAADTPKCYSIVTADDKGMFAGISAEIMVLIKEAYSVLSDLRDRRCITDQEFMRAERICANLITN